MSHISRCGPLAYYVVKLKIMVSAGFAQRLAGIAIDLRTTKGVASRFVGYEPMAARIAPDDVDAKHQSLKPLRREGAVGRGGTLCRRAHLRAAEDRAAIADPRLDHRRHRYPEVAQALGRGRTAILWRTRQAGNGQVAVTLSVASAKASLPIALRLYLPEGWAKDKARCQEAGIP